MNGMEMMVTSLLKSMKINPEELKVKAEETISVIQGKINAINEHLSLLESNQRHIMDSLLRLEIKFNTLPESDAKQLLSANDDVVKELERIYGRNDNDDSNGNG